MVALGPEPVGQLGSKENASMTAVGRKCELPVEPESGRWCRHGGRQDLVGDPVVALVRLAVDFAGYGVAR